MLRTTTDLLLKADKSKFEEFAAKLAIQIHFVVGSEEFVPINSQERPLEVVDEADFFLFDEVHFQPAPKMIGYTATPVK